MQPFTSLYTHNRERSKTFSTANTEESMTQKGDAAEADINVIMKRYQPGAPLPQVTQQPIYGDFTEIGDYRSMVEKINAANEAFNQVPAHIRRRFGNDPQEFMNFVHNKDNLDELRKLGLANPEPTPPPKPAPMEVIITNPPDPKT